MSDGMILIHEYSIVEMPKKRLLLLFKAGAKLFKICETKTCDKYQDYQLITSDRELMTYCLRCGRKVLRYGVQEK
ncbi:MAG: hypothetical protein JRF33_24420 [Deltaproteobacteria bacterium]|nr:hypothetical protein [Deltaproteobacteria bacterium]